MLCSWGCQQKPEKESATTSAQPEEQLSYDTLRPAYAQNFLLVRAEHYTEALVLSPYPESPDTLRYFLVPKKNTKTFIAPHQGQVIGVPLARTVVFSAPHFGLIEALGQEKSVKAVSNLHYMASQALQEQIIVELGAPEQSSTEALLGLKPDAVFLTAVTQEGFQKWQKKAGIPLVYCSEWLENTPLGRAEWIRFIAAFYGKEAEAADWFEQRALKYETLRKRVAEQPTVSCFTGSPFRGVWYMAKGDSYITNLLRDAGGAHLWAEHGGQGSLPLDVEVVYQKAKDAEFWINAQATSMEELQAQHVSFAAFRAFGKGNVLVNTNYQIEGVNAYWTKAIAEPERLLQDLTYFLHPDLLPEDYKPRYYQRLP